MSKRKGEFNARTKYAAWVRSGGSCENPECQRPIKPGRPEYDHATPLAYAIDGMVRLNGDLVPVDSLDNCRVLCAPCHGNKTDNEDIPDIARTNKRRKTDLNLRGKKLGRPIPGSKRSGWRKRMDRTVEKRQPGQPKAYDIPKYSSLKAYGLENLSGKKPEGAYTTQTDGIVLVRTYTEVNHDVISALNDKEHMRYSEQRRRSHTVLTQRQYLNQMHLEENLTLGIFIQDERREYNILVGTMGCMVDRHNHILDMGIMILPKWHGLGYGFRAWCLVKIWALSPEGGAFFKVEAGHHACNNGMFKICARSGMEVEGKRRQHFLSDDGCRSDLIYWGQNSTDGVLLKCK